MLPWGKKALLSRVTLLSPVFLLSAFNAAANPTGGQVAAGQATMQTQGTVLTVTNSPGAIINWQNFSIGAGERTNFVQQSASSAVLNRVVTQNVSSIAGTLQSNGRVFLVNPNGILFGAGAQVNTAAFTASTGNISDADFLSGNHGWPGSGSFLSIEGGTIVVQQGSMSITNAAIDAVGGVTIASDALIINSPSLSLTNGSTPLHPNQPVIFTSTTQVISGGSISIQAANNFDFTGVVSTTANLSGNPTSLSLIATSGTGISSTPVVTLTNDSTSVRTSSRNVTLTSGTSTTITTDGTGNSSTLFVANTGNRTGAQTIRGNVAFTNATIMTANSGTGNSSTSVIAITDNTTGVRTTGGSITLVGGTVNTTPVPAATVPVVATNQPTPTIFSNVATSGAVAASASRGTIPNVEVTLAAALNGAGLVQASPLSGDRAVAAPNTVALANAGASQPHPAVSVASLAAPVRSGAGVATINLQKREPLF